MRVVHLIQSASRIYGAERCLLLELAALKGRGHDVHAVIVHELRHGPDERRLEDEVRSRGFSVSRVEASGQVSLGLLRSLGEALSALRPDVIHSHSMKTDVLALPVARARRLPFVIEVHGYLRPADDRRVRLYEKLDQLALRFASGVLVLSRDYEREVRAYGVPAARVHLCPSGIDVTALQRAAASRTSHHRDLRAELRLPSDQLILGMVARLSAEKGHGDFLQALATLRREGLRAIGVLYGEGPLRESLQSECARLGLADAVIFGGYVDDVTAVYRSLDVLVSCSRFEGLPLNLIEAMALGVPVVAMATGGCADIVVDGQTGLLSPRGDVPALTASLRRICTEPGLRESLGSAGAVRAEKEYSLNAWAERVERCYEQAIATQAPRARPSLGERLRSGFGRSPK